MIVCLCHRISDRDIAAAVRSGTRCFEMLQDETRVASSCGCCLECSRGVFDDAVSRLAPTDAAAPANAAVTWLAPATV